MTDILKKDLRHLQQCLEAEKETFSTLDIEKIFGAPIDRDFPLNLWDFSLRELNSWQGDQLSLLNSAIDPRPDSECIVSHRRLLGKYIIKIKKVLLKIFSPYSNLLLEKQRLFNQEMVAFCLATFIRQQRLEQNLADLQRRVDENELFEQSK